MPRTTRITTDVKKRFVQHMKETGDNRTESYIRTMGRPNMSREWANQAGSKLFKDPEVQEIYKAAGVDLVYLARKNYDLMENAKPEVQVQLVKQFNSAVLRQAPTESKRLNINLFGDLTDAQVEQIRQGRKAIGADRGAGESQPE
jgi:hypothetical protein